MSTTKLLLLEYVTGGGLYDTALEPELAKEGDAMLQALLRDCAALSAQLNITVMRDARLPLKATHAFNTVMVDENFQSTWHTQLAYCDAVWIVAPETGGVLLQLVSEALAAGKRVLNASLQSIATCTDKLRTAEHLQAQGITTVPTFVCTPEIIAEPPATLLKCKVIVKPKDGAGCMNTYLFESVAHIEGQHDLVQAYVAGTPLSVCVWCEAGNAKLLSINEQLILYEQHESFKQLQFEGCRVNQQFTKEVALRFNSLAQQIITALPGLWGPVGIDVVMQEESQDLVVIEINPRMTTSFVALREARSINLAKLVFDENTSKHWPTGKTISLRV